ncbi:MAG: histidine phosphatase family protein [Oscillospiraceae bacterium]|nr:histidine phosphatase family protein [Oscillospiraceae bacterium]
MKIIFVRHGHPDYVNDCLTELGHQQAKQAAMRLKDEGIEQIFSSPFGRAYETAMHTAEVISKDVTKLDFAREIKWGASDGGEVYADGHPWDTSLYAVSLGYSLMDESWTKTVPFCNNVVFDEIERVAKGTDEWLESLGYKREGANYRVIGDDTDRIIALFSYGGSSSAIFSHMLNLPFFYLCRAICPDFTSITVLSLSDEKGTLTAPMIELANDSRHIKGSGVSYQM